MDISSGSPILSKHLLFPILDLFILAIIAVKLLRLIPFKHSLALPRQHSIDAPLLYERGTLYVGTVGARLLAFYDGADSSIYGLKKAVHANTNTLMQYPVWERFKVTTKGLV